MLREPQSASSTVTEPDGVHRWVADVIESAAPIDLPDPPSLSIMCPICGGHLCTLGEVDRSDECGEPDSGYMIYHRERTRVIPARGLPRNGPRPYRLERRYVTTASDGSEPLVLTCAGRGHRTRPLLAEWFSRYAVPAIKAGYETVTVNRRHMEAR